MTDASTDPYLRFATPNSGQGSLSSSTYLRLGGYIAGEEATLLPTSAGAADASGIPISPQVTTSTATLQDYGSSEAYAKAQHPGSPTTSEQVVVVKTSPALTPSGAGLMLYSNQDMLVRTEGSAFIRYGGGQGTVVLGGDSETDVPAGQYRLNALNGVAVTAGTSSAPADIVLTAYNTVSLTSLGPTDSVSYGDTSSKTHGDSHSVTWGDSYSEVHGTTTSLLYGASRSWAFDNDVTGKFADSLLLLVGTTTSIVLGASISVVVGNMSYVYLLTYFELYATAFVSIKLGKEFYVKDLAVKYAAAEVAAGEIQANVVEARTDAAEIDLKTVEMAVQKRTVKFDSHGAVTEMSETRMIMAAMSIHM